LGALAVVLLAGAYWYWSSRHADGVAFDLVDAFPEAEKKTSLNATSAFAMDPQTVSGVTRASIYMHPTSRVIYHAVTIPQGARFRAWLALKEEVWDKATDGALFRVGVSSGGEYTEVVNRAVNPYTNPSDRGWLPVEADLSRWAGKQVDVILNTNASPPGMAPNDMYDFAVFGAPAIVVPPPPQ
jgi:hypothetical protein